MPAPSGHARSRGTCSGSRRASTSVTAPTGTLTRKTHRQSAASIRVPPIDGPAAAASAADAPHSPTAAERRSCGTASSSSASELGTTPAAAAAWSTRSRTSTSTLCASAAPTDATVNAATDHANRRRWPSVSAYRPAGTSSAANTTL